MQFVANLSPICEQRTVHAKWHGELTLLPVHWHWFVVSKNQTARGVTAREPLSCDQRAGARVCLSKRLEFSPSRWNERVLRRSFPDWEDNGKIGLGALSTKRPPYCCTLAPEMRTISFHIARSLSACALAPSGVLERTFAPVFRKRFFISGSAAIS